MGMKKLVLLVEDEANIRTIMEFAIEEMGFEALVARDAEEALVLLKDASPQLILLDVLLPGMDGWELCKQIKSNIQLKFIPVIIVTANTSAIEQLAKESGADACLYKPFTTFDLIRQIQQFIYRR